MVYHSYPHDIIFQVLNILTKHKSYNCQGREASKDRSELGLLEVRDKMYHLLDRDVVSCG